MELCAFALALINGFLILRLILPRLYFLWKVRKYMQFHWTISRKRGRIVLSRPVLTLGNRIFTRKVPLADGESEELAFDYFTDHADTMWSHSLRNCSGHIFVEQRTECYGRDAGMADGLYIGRSLLSCRKLDQDESVKVKSGDVIVQLRVYLKPDRSQRHIELIKPQVVAAKALTRAA